MVLGTVVAFFGTGLFSSSGIMGSETFPISLRAPGQGFTHNGARSMSSVAPLLIGRVGESRGLGWAFLCAAAYLLAAWMTKQLPETTGAETGMKPGVRRSERTSHSIGSTTTCSSAGLRLGRSTITMAESTSTIPTV
jgi:hypothetical protein